MSARLVVYLSKRWKPFLHISPSAVLVLSWSYLMYTHYFCISRFTGGSATEKAPTAWYIYGFFLLTSFGYFSFPLFGLLADIWIGRYKAILIGTVLCFLSWIIIGIGFIVDSYYDYEAVLWSIYGIAYFFQFGGFTSFTANIIQYNIDQLVGASAEELNSVIYWHILCEPLVALLFYPLQCLFNGNYFIMILFI